MNTSNSILGRTNTKFFKTKTKSAATATSEGLDKILDVCLVLQGFVCSRNGNRSLSDR